MYWLLFRVFVFSSPEKYTELSLYLCEYKKKNQQQQQKTF